MQMEFRTAFKQTIITTGIIIKIIKEMALLELIYLRIILGIGKGKDFLLRLRKDAPTHLSNENCEKAEDNQKRALVMFLFLKLRANDMGGRHL